MTGRGFRLFPGHEFAGIVDTLAPEAAGVRVGDAVYALSSFCRNGSAAEFIAIRATDLAPKPHSLNFEQCRYRHTWLISGR
jgi:NADPH:quinone reductase-like Zn-dependent oxidoreductase